MSVTGILRPNACLAIASEAHGRKRLRLVKPPKVHNALVLLLQPGAYPVLSLSDYGPSRCD